MNASYSLGIDVGGTKIAFGLFDENRRLVAKSRVTTVQGQQPKAFIQGLSDQARALCSANGVEAGGLSGAGVGMPCFIRQPDGYVMKSSNIPALRGCAVKEELRQAFGGIRIEVDNDTHAAALAENRCGAGKGVGNMLYCAVSSGIASAMIIDGKLFRGSFGFSGESGHMLVTPDEGLRCTCGKRGCFMSWCSGQMIVKHVARWIREGQPTVMTELAASPEQITAGEIERAWRMGDPLGCRAVRQMQHYLALWLFNLYVFTNIGCFVLGGGLLKMGDDFWQPVFDEFNSLNGDTCDGCTVSFRKAGLGDDFGIVGANELLY